MSELDVLRRWPPRRWLTAVVSGAVVALLVSLPTAVIENPVFGRAVDVTWWSYPVVVATGILSGLLIATYVDADQPEPDSTDRPTRFGIAGTLLSLFAVGCPVCNKLVLIALGASGAMSVFAPLQPILAIASVALLAYALRVRLRGELACAVSR